MEPINLSYFFVFFKFFGEMESGTWNRLSFSLLSFYIFLNDRIHLGANILPLGLFFSFPYSLASCLFGAPNKGVFFSSFH